MSDGPYRSDSDSIEQKLAGQERVISDLRQRARDLVRCIGYIATFVFGMSVGIAAMANERLVVRAQLTECLSGMSRLHEDDGDTNAGALPISAFDQPLYVELAYHEPPSCVETGAVQPFMQMCDSFRGECLRTCSGIGAEVVRYDWADGNCTCSGVDGVTRFTNRFESVETLLTTRCLPADPD